MAKKVMKPEKKVKKDGWIFPIPSKRETQGFTGGHGGRDYGLPTGSPVVAPHKGKVVFAGKDTSGYGNLIKIQTGDGKTVYLAHLSQIDVKVGQIVDAGKLIGRTGNTGNSTGPHLHYEIREGSKKIDPLLLYGNGGTYKVTGRAGAGAQIKEKAAKGETPSETAQAKIAADIEAIKQGANPFTFVTDWIEGLNWGNVIAAVVGILLITIGVFGLVTGEAAKIALQPLTEAIQQ